MMTEKEIDELKSLVEKIAAVLAQQQRIINERNIKSIHKAEDFVRESVKNLKAARAELYKADKQVR
jgi:phosphoheptose isomerase